MNRTGFIIVMVYLFLCSCHDNAAEKVPLKPGSEQMEELNRIMVRKDRERIQSYIERKGLRMTESPTGLWYQVTKEGNGENFSDNSTIKYEYTCSLLDGTVCYSSSETGPRSVVLGKTSMEPGLRQGLKLLRPGSEAIFIIPPFLAYGLPGDGKKIPPRSVIIYNISIAPGE